MLEPRCSVRANKKESPAGQSIGVPIQGGTAPDPKSSASHDLGRKASTVLRRRLRSAWMLRTTRPTQTMSLLRASPRNLERPTIISSKSIVPPPSTSKVSKRSNWSSSDMSSSSNITLNSLNVRKKLNNCGVICNVDASSMSKSDIGTTTRSCKLRSLCGVQATSHEGSVSLWTCTLQTRRTSSAAFSANICVSNRRCRLWTLLLHFAAARVFSTKIAAITLKRPTDINIVINTKIKA
mmetsp:Transcript_94605/g.262824  ORF Transcript_94605/g.262824 Transcript_94605/m.262824 type:complete len:238 (+) Transcript_94605:124-837(+)